MGVGVGVCEHAAVACEDAGVVYEYTGGYEDAGVHGRSGVAVHGRARVILGRRTGVVLGRRTGVVVVRWARPPVHGRVRLVVLRGTWPAAVAIFMAAL
ncbi:hypothetical protein [Streptomyces sp. NPDC002769]|uniref:hypothetical protein n=1 Tax=Streptomyces sp. NPDC002769 TaxID=3154542 RepID=UPI0033219AE4